MSKNQSMKDRKVYFRHFSLQKFEVLTRHYLKLIKKHLMNLFKIVELIFFKIINIIQNSIK